MTPEALCTLAFAAIEDDAARPILADALEDLSWWNKQLERGWVGRYRSADVLCAVLRGQVARSPVTAARSVAAVLVFRGWPKSWPLAAECRRKASLDRMQIRTLDMGDGRYDVTCPSLLVEQIGSFDELLVLIDELGAMHPDERVLISLDQLHQAGYTSMHATNTHGLDDREGYDLSGVDPAASEFFVLEANFRKLCGAASFDDACARGLTMNDQEMSILERINDDPALILDAEVVVRRVPVRESSMVISALPNGYFTDDLDPFENYALAEHLRLHYGYRLFGMGASSIAFRREQPLDAEMAARLGDDLARLYHCTEEPEKAARFAHVAHRHGCLFLKYADTWLLPVPRRPRG